MTDTNTLRKIGILALGGVLVAFGAAAADDASKTVEAGGMKFQAPESWKAIPSRSQMRKAQLQVEPAKGDDFPALLVVYVFPGGAGTVEANIARWQKQFKGADGGEAKIESKKLKAKNAEVTLVETSGHYTPSQFPGVAPEPERESARLLGGIVTTEKYGYFLKMVGPDKTMTSIRPAFEKLLESIEIGDE